MSNVSAAEIDRIFDDGGDVTEFFDMEHPVIRRGSKSKEIRLEMPLWVAEGIEREAGNCGVPATDLMNLWLAERVKAEMRTA